MADDVVDEKDFRKALKAERPVPVGLAVTTVKIVRTTTTEFSIQLNHDQLVAILKQVGYGIPEDAEIIATEDGYEDVVIRSIGNGLLNIKWTTKETVEEEG